MGREGWQRDALPLGSVARAGIGNESIRGRQITDALMFFRPESRTFGIGERPAMQARRSAVAGWVDGLQCRTPALRRESEEVATRTEECTGL